MEEIKRKLVESGVIGRIVDDFNPHIEFSVFYGGKRMSLGDQVLPAKLQRKPVGFRRHGDVLAETFKKPELVAFVMTDPDSPRGEYLHWIIALPFLAKPREGVAELRWKELVPYEAPRPGAHMLVFTLFDAHQFRSIFKLPKSREKFSTRNFAHANALGSPLGATFFNINDQNADENETSDDNGSVTYQTESEESCSKLKDDAKSTCKRKLDYAEPSCKRKLFNQD